ncbi:unnamed protein product [Candida verbasci]|uniref:SIS domain-containing protein n=1 Tax=Candida verbasci TaxID=1227364 RepID=A0A9W4U0N0_9ASCO|nr:unnamed protein product [Candida verbasci]
MTLDNLSIQNTLNCINNTLKCENEAVNNLHQQYLSDEFSIANLMNSINILYNTITNDGKIIITGIGKSYKLSLKLVATLNSLSIQSAALHPSEALHGDLGSINLDKDCLIMVTASGNTPELINLLPHLSGSGNLPIILLTCNKNSKLSQSHQINSLIYANLLACHQEEVVHGIPAPTISYTLSLILADSVILAMSELFETDLIKRKKLFSIKHPGGSIGENLNQQFSEKSSTVSLLSLRQTNSNSNSIPQSISSNSSNISDDDIDILITHNNTVPTTTNRRILSYKEVLNIDEITLLKYITLYDSFLINDTKLSIGSNKIKELYRFYQGNNWDKFKWDLLRAFS